MGLLDKVGSSPKPAAPAATKPAQTVEKAAPAPIAEKADPRLVKKAKDNFGTNNVVVPAKVTAPVIPSKHFYDGITNAFSRTASNIRDTVSSTVKSVETSVSAASQAVADAGKAVQNAGQQVVDSGRAIVHAGAKAAGDVKQLAVDAGTLVSEAGQIASDAGRAAYHAGNAALTGNPKELEAAHKAIASARVNVSDARAAITDAKAAATDLGQQGTNVSTAIGAATAALDDAKHKLEKAGDSVSGAIGAFASAPGTIVKNVANALEQGGAEAKAAFEKDVPGGKQMLGGIGKYLTGAKDVAVGLATGNPFALAKGIKEQTTGIVDFGKGVVQTPAYDAAKKFVVDYANGFNVDKQIKSLKPGESYELKIGANIHVEVGGEAKGALKVEANKDGTFTVNASGSAGINGYLHAGGRVDLGAVRGSAGAEGSARALIGGNLELKCANAEEAAKAAQIFEKLAAGTTAAGLIASGGKPITKEEAEFLKAKTTGLEVSGSVAGQIEAALGLDKGILKAGIGGTVGLSSTQSVKIELEHGKPTGLAVKQEYAGEVEAHGGLTVGLPTKKDSKDPLDAPKTVFQGKVSDTLVLETHYDFPKNVSLGDFQKDPGAAIAKAAAEMQKGAVTKATLTTEGEGTIAGKTGNIRGEISFSGKPAEVFNAAAFDAAMRGNWAGAAKAMGDKVQVDGTLSTYTQKKWGVDGVGGDVLGVGLEATFQATRRKVDDPPLVQFSISGTQYATRIAQNAAELMQARRTGMAAH